ncbi:FG-GAP-like repeat-containing protein [Tahibacter caeni]|uniref:FG-GAP-like repeat-containing protein n=1 Tax=Tahibacter caeni TaxID=1453545 RepID=UPI002147CA38|nr:FG-GAP-like repeat-containing protein [Tahibacter caeni]
MSLNPLRHFRAWLLAAAALFAAADAAAQSRFVVTSPGDSGPGTLRDAINQANANADRSTIDFDIDTRTFGSGPWRITPRSNLPEFKTPVTVRGYSQPGAIAPTSIANGRLMIEMDTGSVEYGLLFIRGAEGSAVSGLAFVNGHGTSPALLIMTGNVRATANMIGIRADGTPDPYGGIGIGAVCGDGIVIGGPQSSAGNMIYGARSGILITGANHVVQNNWFGVDTLGTSPMSGMILHDGVVSGSIAVNPPKHLLTMYSAAVQQSFFGLRDSLIADNLFAQVGDNAIRLLGGNQNPTRGNSIRRNIFGRDVWGGSFAYVDVAVRLSKDARDNLVSDNIIAKANSGLLLGDAQQSPPTLAGSGNRLSRNLMYDVAYPLIGLDAANQFAPLANDPQDADSGPNGLQNHPELTTANAAGGVEGRLDAVPRGRYTIEFFLAASCHPSGSGPADFYLGSTDVDTDGSGVARFSTLFPQRPFGGLRAGDQVSATATDAAGNTSEFSHCLKLDPAVRPTLVIDALGSPRPAMDTALPIAATISGSASRPPGGEIVFYARTATDRRELGRAAISGGRAALATPAQGFFVNAGRYQIEAEYAGDGFHTPASAAPQPLVVFRPAIATLDYAYSSPVRRDLSNGDREYYETPMRTWRRLDSKPDDSWIDSDRFGGAALDSMIVRDSLGFYQQLDPRGQRNPLFSGAIRATAQIADLLQADADVRADAIVRDPSDGWLLVHCAFVVDGCERAERLDMNLEYDFVLSGEFNGDGLADLAWRNRSSGEITIWLMDGSKPFRSYVVRPPNNAPLAAAVDVNGDGYEDLVWQDAGKVIVSLMDQGVPRQDFSTALPSATTAVAGGAHLGFPGDGDYGSGHLLLRDAATGETLVWRDTRIVRGVLTARPQTVYFDPNYTLERTR